MGILVLFLTLEGMLSAFQPLSMMLAVDLSYMTFIMFRYISSMPTFWRVFIINGFWILSKAFCIYWDDHMVFVLQFVNMVYHIDWFVDTEKSLCPWDKSHLITVYDYFNVLLTSICCILLRILHLCSSVMLAILAPDLVLILGWLFIVFFFISCSNYVEICASCLWILSYDNMLVFEYYLPFLSSFDKNYNQ